MCVNGLMICFVSVRHSVFYYKERASIRIYEKCGEENIWILDRLSDKRQNRTAS